MLPLTIVVGLQKQIVVGLTPLHGFRLAWYMWRKRAKVLRNTAQAHFQFEHFLQC